MRTLVLAAAALLSVACVATVPTGDDVEASTEALSADCPENRGIATFDYPAAWKNRYGLDGVCVASRYDCRMPTTDGDMRRYLNPKDSADGAWPVAKGIPVVDGRGNAIGSVTTTTTKLNYGQKKKLDGKEYVYAFSVGSGDADVSGWVPAACIGWGGTTAPSASCLGSSASAPSSVPVVNGRRPAAKYDAATSYVIRATNPMLDGVDLDRFKIVCNAPDEPHRSIEDYMPRLSADGTFFTINLLANLPGMHPAVGGIAADTLRVAHREGQTMISDGVVFHRLVHVPSVPVYLFKPKSSAAAADDHTRTVFVYGWVAYPSGGGKWARRYGWIAYWALSKS